MKIKDYQVACHRTTKDLGDMLNMAHMALGFASELGELQECLCKGETQEDLNLVNLGEELGDKMWYAGNWANYRGYKLDDSVFETPFIYTPYDHLMIDGGNLADYAKRWLAYGQKIEDQKKAKDEWIVLSQYISAIQTIASINGLNIEIIMAKNIAKLYKRYPDNFSEDKAIIRDLEEELKVLS